MTHRVVIVEDEPAAGERLRRLLRSHSTVEVVGSAGTVEQALAVVAETRPDVLFLDVQLPGEDGFELLRRLPEPIPVVFTTAHDRHALRAFEATSIDYLLKPIEAEALQRAVDKLDRLLGDHQPAALEARLARLLQAIAAERAQRPARPLQRLGVSRGDRTLVLAVAEIAYFGAEDKYVVAHTRSGAAHIVDFSLADLERRLDPDRFVRVHRSALVNLECVREVHRWFGGKGRLILDDATGSVVVASKARLGLVRERLGLRGPGRT